MWSSRGASRATGRPRCRSRSRRHCPRRSSSPGRSWCWTRPLRSSRRSCRRARRRRTPRRGASPRIRPSRSGRGGGRGRTPSRAAPRGSSRPTTHARRPRAPRTRAQPRRRRRIVCPRRGSAAGAPSPPPLRSLWWRMSPKRRPERTFPRIPRSNASPSCANRAAPRTARPPGGRRPTPPRALGRPRHQPRAGSGTSSRSGSGGTRPRAASRACSRSSPQRAGSHSSARSCGSRAAASGTSTCRRSARSATRASMTTGSTTPATACMCTAPSSATWGVRATRHQRLAAPAVSLGARSRRRGCGMSATKASRARQHHRTRVWFAALQENWSSRTSGCRPPGSWAVEAAQSRAPLSHAPGAKRKSPRMPVSWPLSPLGLSLPSRLHPRRLMPPRPRGGGTRSPSHETWARQISRTLGWASWRTWTGPCRQ
mmetsp:Transcript_96199/g.299672  ORF Transcript_96199/g.299672 Transcript_96199/m.299672 type:complete len:428 (+) Transcript_96199:857-2140(+)